jgi:hypothetical protein
VFRQEADSQRGAIEERQRRWEAKKPFTLEEQFDESDRVQSEAALPKLQFIRQIVEILGPRDPFSQDFPYAVGRRSLCHHRRHSMGSVFAARGYLPRVLVFFCLEAPYAELPEEEREDVS